MTSEPANASISSLLPTRTCSCCAPAWSIITSSGRSGSGCRPASILGISSAWPNRPSSGTPTAPAIVRLPARAHRPHLQPDDRGDGRHARQPAQRLVVAAAEPIAGRRR